MKDCNMAQTIIHSVRLFDGTDVHESATVSVSAESGQITTVSLSSGPSGPTTTPYPAGTTVIDGTGHTLLPGLIEGHIHAHAQHLPPGEDRDSVLKPAIKCGVTTV